MPVSSEVFNDPYEYDGESYPLHMNEVAQVACKSTTWVRDRALALGGIKRQWLEGRMQSWRFPEYDLDEKIHNIISMEDEMVTIPIQDQGVIYDLTAIEAAERLNKKLSWVRDHAEDLGGKKKSWKDGVRRPSTWRFSDAELLTRCKDVDVQMKANRSRRTEIGS